MREMFGIDQPAAFIDVHGATITIGPTKSKQNHTECRAAINICSRFVQTKIAAKDIAILTGYQAQATLLKKAFTTDGAFCDVEAHTIDSY